MNKVFMVGRLVADPQPYTTANGYTQARVTIATQDNRVKTESYFFPCIA
jgi:single-stranded DNA-binding protein